MKYFQKIVWVVLALHLVLLIGVVVTFHVDDMTLSRGEVYEFNHGWVITGNNGESHIIEELPYLGKSLSGEKVVLENTIPEEYLGKTLSFLSADKELQVWIDDKLIYEFGVHDVRGFGHTPGSIYNFIDIPLEVSQGRIRMEMSSPYEDFAAKISTINVGERDVLILKLLKDNLLNILCNLIILISGIIFFLLFIIQLSSKQDTGGMQYLGGYCIVASLYYFVETKILHIFYGNQSLYSVMVFLCLMIMPFFICLYYAKGIFVVYQKRFKILSGIICMNIALQLVLQLLNVVDFMNMAVFSHALIAGTVLVVAKSYFDIVKKERNKNILLGMIALLFMGGGGAIDIVRMYVVAVGDMGKYSRLGATCFSIIMLYQHLSHVITGYNANIEEKTRLMKHEMEFMEKKNEQLEKANAIAEEARQEAIAANAAKGKFLAQMSHEIRTPINAILGMDTMILRETKDMQIKEYALDIQNASQSLLALINDILDFSKIESGKLEIISVEYDFCSLIHDISNMIKSKAETKKLKLHIFVDEKLPSKLLGDDVRVRQVLVNLLNNAVKYTHQGSITLRVNGRQEGGKVILDFSIQDTGIGIKEEDIHKLFEEFERIEEKRNRNIEGTGLGINITTQLLWLMGSRLNVESVYGEGSKFYFTLEQQIVDSTPVGNLEERIREQSEDYTYTAAFTAPDAQILVVDDNLINLKVFVSLLKRTKMCIDVVDSGKACLEMVSKKHYDLIFLDHMMPEMDGIETLHKLQQMQESKCSDTPIVALTANAITGAKEMYLAEGFDAFLSKPVNPEKLEQMILKLLPRELLKFDVEEETEEEMEERTGDVSEQKSCQKVDLPIIEGMDWNYGLMHLPNKELLLSTIEDFYKTLESEASALEGFYQEMNHNPEMLNQYRIKVHSMKSSANLIGATVLGGMARLLEDAAREKNTSFIESLNDVFLAEWRGYKDKLKVCISSAEEDKTEKKLVQNYTEILGYLDMLQKALSDMDVDVMDYIMKQLEEFCFSEEIQNRMDELGVLVTNLDEEQGTVVIEELKKMMG